MSESGRLRPHRLFIEIEVHGLCAMALESFRYVKNSRNELSMRLRVESLVSEFRSDSRNWRTSCSSTLLSTPVWELKCVAERKREISCLYAWIVLGEALRAARAEMKPSRTDSSAEYPLLDGWGLLIRPGIFSFWGPIVGGGYVIITLVPELVMQ